MPLPKYKFNVAVAETASPFSDNTVMADVPASSLRRVTLAP